MNAQLRLSLAGVVATLAAALTLHSLFLTAGWFPETLVCVAAVAAASYGARQLGVPKFLEPLAGAAGLVLMVTLVFAHDVAFFGVIPTPRAFDAFDLLVADARDTIAAYAAPVTATQGLTFLTASGVGLVALVVDVLVVTLRRPASAGLPLLAVYTVPAAVAPGGVGWISFAIGAAGYLALLLTDARVRVTRWGRPLGRGRNPLEGSSSLGSAGRRVGALAVALAVLAPAAAAPGLERGVFGGSGFGAGNGNGPSRVTVGNPIFDLGRDLNQPADTEVMVYQTNSDSPGYLRMVSLDDFSSTAWQPSPMSVSQKQTVDKGLSNPPGLSDSTRRSVVTSRITILDYDSSWLPLPYPASKVEDIQGTWVWDGATFNVFSPHKDDLKGQNYVVTSLSVQPTAEQLNDAGAAASDAFKRFLKLPAKMPPIIEQTARRVTDGASTPYEKAVALQAWLRSFDYDTKAPDGSGMQAIANFLQTKRGFCVHFASTMAVMARQLGIPSRVAVGFIPGAEDVPGRRVITTHDLHAWPELYFEGAGWLPFEPTPPARTGQPPSYTLGLPASGDGTQATAPATTQPSASPSPGSTFAGSPNQREHDPDALRQSQAQARAGSGIPWALALGVLVVVAACVMPALTRLTVRRRRWRRARTPETTAVAAWADLQDSVADFGLGVPRPATPRQFVAHLAGNVLIDDEARDAAGRIAVAAERSEFARSVGEVGDLRTDVSTVRDSLASSASRGQRLRAAVLPSSTLRVVHGAGERVADALDWVDGVASRGRDRLRRR